MIAPFQVGDYVVASEAYLLQVSPYRTGWVGRVESIESDGVGQPVISVRWLRHGEADRQGASCWARLAPTPEQLVLCDALMEDGQGFLAAQVLHPEGPDLQKGVIRAWHLSKRPELIHQLIGQLPFRLYLPPLGAAPTSWEHWAHMEDRSVRVDGWRVVPNGRVWWVVYRGDVPDQLWRGKVSTGRRRGPFRRWSSRERACAAVDQEVPLDGK